MLTFKTIEYDKSKNGIIILDQTKLPEQEIYVTLKNTEEVYQAIKQLKVRGAPLIGVTAAYGLAQIARYGQIEKIIAAAHYLKSARPTAVNLQWAIERLCTRLDFSNDLYNDLLKEARLIHKEDCSACRHIGQFGEPLIKNNTRIMVHCNAGALATTGIGTALGVLYTAHQKGKRFKVYCCETRPLLQGARLTSWELSKNGIEAFAICDNMAAFYMSEVDLLIVGADRIAQNGDTANKIGTYGLAIIAHHIGIPFYVAAPLSSFDYKIKSGKMIPIEMRGEKEIRFFNNKKIVADAARVCNPAFDITPADLISGIITERGILKPPYEKSIKALFS